MKSQLIKLKETAEIGIPEKFVTMEVSKEEIEKAVLHLRENYQTIESVSDCVKDGDFVVIEKDGEKKCYNTARNFFDIQLVTACMGHYKGEQISAEDGTTGIIISVKRKRIPPFDDVLAEKAGENSAEACRAKLIEGLVAKKKKEAQEQLIAYLAEQTVRLSEYELCHEEIEKQAEKLKEEIKQFSKEQDMPLSEGVQELLQVFEIEETEGNTVEDNLYAICEKQMKVILLGNEYLKPYHIVLGYEKYEKAVAQLENAMRKYIRQWIQVKVTVERNGD